jgi:hemoglobin
MENRSATDQASILRERLPRCIRRWSGNNIFWQRKIQRQVGVRLLDETRMRQCGVIGLHKPSNFNQGGHMSAAVELSLYERLGGRGKIHQITEDVWINHISNPDVSARYANSDAEKIKSLVTEFVCWGTGGPEQYSGKDMLTAHRTMNISHREFMAVIDDVMRALEKNKIAKREQNEMLGLLMSLKDQVIHR